MREINSIYNMRSKDIYKAHIRNYIIISRLLGNKRGELLAISQSMK